MNKKMKKLKQTVVVKKEKLNKLLAKEQAFTHETICLSQELDILIAQYYKIDKEIDSKS